MNENMTWQDVLDHLLTMTNDELQDHATINVISVGMRDEFYGVFRMVTSKDGDPADGFLKHGHHYMVMER